MKYSLERKEKGIVEATIDLPNKEWSEYIEKAYQKNKGKFSVQGFRKGHAPKHVIEQTYGQGVFVQDALDEVFYMSYTKILQENEDIKPVEAPKMDIKKFDADKVVITLTMTCVPDFKLAEYKGLEFTKTVNPVTDEMVNESINRELLRASKLVSTNAPVKNDDFVTLDFEGFIDGKAFEGGKAEKYQLKIGSHSFIDTFEDQLVGLNIGDEKEVNVKFPADYHQKDLAGKPAMFKVKIHDIRERVMPELNDEFVQNSSEFDTVEAYTKNVREKLASQEEERAEIELDNAILDRIVNNTEIELPESLINQEVDRMMNGMQQQLAYQGATLEDYAKYMGITLDALRDEQKDRATHSVKARFVLEKLIREEKLDITDADVDNKLKEYAEKQNKSLEEYKKTLSNDMINSVANEILMKKILDFLRANNTIK